MPNRALQNERFWEFGYFYDAKSIIVSYLDFNSRISLICTSHDFSDRFILDKYDKETNPKDKLTAHARLRKIISVISHYRHMPPLQHLQNLKFSP